MTCGVSIFTVRKAQWLGVSLKNTLPSYQDTEPDSSSTSESDDESQISRDTEASDDEDPEDQPLIVVDIYQEDDGPALPGQDDPHPGPAAADQPRVAVFRCQCKCFDGGPCCRRFTEDEFTSSRDEMAELTSAEKDMFIFGQIRCFSRNSSHTVFSKRKEQKERRFQRSTYLYHGEPICRDTFLFLHNMSINKLNALTKHYREHGCTARSHKNKGKTFSNHLSYVDRTRVQQFIKNYAELHAILLPGRIPGYKRDDIKLLPSSESKTNVWRQYKAAMGVSGDKAVANSTFRKLWNTLCPYVICCKPMSDVCWICQRNNSLLYKSANLSDVDKSERCRMQQAHLTKVAQERSLYRDQSQRAKLVAEQQGVTGLGKNNACSKPVEMHYSFDFAQQVHYPSDPFQPGPVYFLTGRKLGIFGIHCEGVTQQVNYLVDEAVAISKGSNAVISFLQHFLTNFGLGETVAHMHCDNCSGQNKNKIMMWYILWRCMWGLHRSIELHFMVVGHTKFAPDWCFGLLKQRYRKTPVSCLDEMTDVVKASTPSGVNIPQLVGTEAGEVIVEQFDWFEFLSGYFKPLVGIKSLQHFRASSDEPGVIYARKSLDDPETPFQLLKSAARRPPVDLPAPVIPPGLDGKRQWYLYEKIREFCSEDTKDTTCPLPAVPKPT